MLPRLLYLAGMGVGVVSLLGLLGGSYWAFDLMSHFRLQYLVLLILASLSLLALKHKRHQHPYAAQGDQASQAPRQARKTHNDPQHAEPLEAAQ